MHVLPARDRREVSGLVGLWEEPRWPVQTADPTAEESPRPRARPPQWFSGSVCRQTSHQNANNSHIFWGFVWNDALPWGSTHGLWPWWWSIPVASRTASRWRLEWTASRCTGHWPPCTAREPRRCPSRKTSASGPHTLGERETGMVWRCK